jgi:cell division septum initiation protein DivIVA
MFRRAVLGYDRFQVDTYVQWAEDELTAADREREHLEERHLQTRAELADARQLLGRSSGGAELLRMSQRVGAMLAAAADEAEGIRAEAAAHRSAAAAEANRKLGYARWRISYAEAKAEGILAETAAEATAMTAAAARVAAAAEQLRVEAQTEVEMRRAEARAVGHRAEEAAAQVLRRAAEDAAAARLQTRGEVVAMLGAAREQRLRADAEAAAVRDRQAQDVATRCDSLVAEVTALEHRRATLQAEIELLCRPAVAGSRSGLELHLGRLATKLRWRPRSLGTP